MASSRAATVDEYLAELPPDRAAVVRTVRDVVLDHLPDGFEETMSWGMISYEIPLARYPDTYNKQPLGTVALAAQARYYSLYLNAVYMSPTLTTRLHEGYEAAGMKLDMGKSCVRFKDLDGIELVVIGDIIAAVTPEDLIATYEAARGER